MFIINMSGVGIKGCKDTYQGVKSSEDTRNKSNVNSNVTTSSKSVHG